MDVSSTSKWYFIIIFSRIYVRFKMFIVRNHNFQPYTVSRDQLTVIAWNDLTFANAHQLFNRTCSKGNSLPFFSFHSGHPSSQDDQKRNCSSTCLSQRHRIIRYINVKINGNHNTDLSIGLLIPAEQALLLAVFS